MENAAKEFLKKSGELYEINKKKWRKIIKEKGLEFSEDIYNDSIIKTYDSILKKEIDTTDYLGYWYSTFINNTKRDELYARNQSVDDDIDVIQYLEEKEDEGNKAEEYYEAISNILLQVRNHFDRKTFETFRIYLLCGISYEQLDNLTGMDDSKRRITKVRKWLHENRQIFYN